MAVVLLKRRDSRNFLPLHQLSSNFSQEKHLVVTPLPSLKSFYTETLNSFTQRKIHPLSATLPSHLFLARAQRIFKARSGLDTPANQFQFPLGDHEKALPYVYFGNVAAATSCINFEDYALILFVFDLPYIVQDCIIRIGVRPENSTPFRSPKIPTVANCWLHWHLLLVRQEIEREISIARQLDKCWAKESNLVLFFKINRPPFGAKLADPSTWDESKNTLK